MRKAHHCTDRSLREVAKIIEKDACVLCSMLKRFQSALIQNANTDDIDALCRFHLWAIAGTADTQVAARIFLQLLDSSRLQEQDPPVARCSVCDQIVEEEARCSEELVQLLRVPEFLGWLREHGAMCIPHARRRLKILRDEDRTVLMAVVRDARARLRDRLNSGVNEPNDRRLPMLLSRVAEYLEGRRGLALKQ